MLVVRVRMFYTLQTGVLRVRIRVLRRPHCPTEVEARWWYLFGETIQNVSMFWNRCGSH